MIKEVKNIQCGIFDSSLLRRGHTQSQEREVVCYELELFAEDSGTSFIDGVRHPVRRGMLLRAKPGQTRHSLFPVRCYFIRLFAGADEDMEATIASFPECFYIEREEDVEELASLFVRLSGHTASSFSSDWRTMRINADLTAILYKCMRLFESSSDAEDGTVSGTLVREAYEYIAENFTRPLTLPEIAEALHVSPSYLHASFKKAVGTTPARLITARRIDRAKRLIAAGEKSMLEIALSVGFCSQSHFNKVFLKECGITPATYKKELGVSY